ncbi:Protein of unknown function [Propionibacterium freudenreichii]|nr:Protein of unknown function [Propionibacterium freudenreichii]
MPLLLEGPFIEA